MSEKTTAQSSHRKFVLAASVVAIIWLAISSVTGPLFGNLSSVQKNDNSKFLPAGAESSKASDAILKFSDTTSNNQFPTLILFEGKVGLPSLNGANGTIFVTFPKAAADNVAAYYAGSGYILGQGFPGGSAGSTNPLKGNFKVMFDGYSFAFTAGS